MVFSSVAHGKVFYGGVGVEMIHHSLENLRSRPSIYFQDVFFSGIKRSAHHIMFQKEQSWGLCYADDAF